MRKAIQLKVTLWIEGEDEPAHDFAKSTTQAVRNMIAVGRWRHPNLKVTIKKVEEDTDDDENGSAPGGDQPTPTKR